MKTLQLSGDPESRWRTSDPLILDPPGPPTSIHIIHINDDPLIKIYMVIADLLKCTFNVIQGQQNKKCSKDNATMPVAL